MGQIAPQSSTSPSSMPSSSSSSVKTIFQRVVAISAIIVVSNYYPSHASSTERSASSSASASWGKLSNNSYRRRGDNTSKQQYQQQQQYHHFKWKNKNTNNDADPTNNNNHHNSEKDCIGVPPVRIGGMILNPPDDDEAPNPSSPNSHNAPPTQTHDDNDTDTEEREVVDPRHSHYKNILKQRNGHTEASLLQLPCSLLLRTTHTSGSSTTTNSIPIATYLDTGAQVTVMTMEAAKRAGLAHLIDGRYAGRAIGVAGVSCGVKGRIPARTVSLVFSGCNEDGSGSVVVDRSPAIFVLEAGIGGSGDGVELLLGLDSLEDWNAGICLRDRTLTIRSINNSKGAIDCRRGGINGGEEDLVISFVNNAGGGTSGKSDHNTARRPPTPKENSHQYQHQKTNKRIISSPPSIPYVGTVTSQRIPAATDLESDLDLLDSSTNSNNGASYHGGSSYHVSSTDKLTSEILREREGESSQENDNSYDDDDYDDDYDDAEFDYDAFNLSGI